MFIVFGAVITNLQDFEKHLKYLKIWELYLNFCMYILMKRDICGKLFLLCQTRLFMCSYKSIIKSKISKIENYS